MIDLQGKNKFVISIVEDAGHSVKGVTTDGVFSWVSTDDTAVQLIIDAYDANPEAQKDKIEELKLEGLRRIQLIFPSISDFDELDFATEQYLSIAPAARQPTTNFQSAIDIRQAAKSAISFINTLGTLTAIADYDVVNTPAWP